LLETLAENILDNLFLAKNIIKIKLRIEKPEIIKNTSSVGVEITKKKND
jgi:dihydroneopterin aldolase